MGSLAEGLKPLAEKLDREGQLAAEVRRLRKKLERVYDRLDAETQRRVWAERDLEQVAGALSRTQEFYDWLLEQDASSAETFSPGKKRQQIEGKSDVELSRLFIAATSAG